MQQCLQGSPSRISLGLPLVAAAAAGVAGHGGLWGSGVVAPPVTQGSDAEEIGGRDGVGEQRGGDGEQRGGAPGATSVGRQERRRLGEGEE